jgi:hypothetical protein
MCFGQNPNQMQDMIDQAQELLKLRQELEDMKTAKAEPKFYRLTFVVKELDASKAINARTYTLLVSTDSSSSIRTGDKLPVAEQNQFDMFNLGTNIDCQHVSPLQNELALNVSVDVTGMSETSGTPARAFVRNYRWSSGVIIPLNKSTLIFSSDHATGKGQMQVELTATPLP